MIQTAIRCLSKRFEFNSGTCYVAYMYIYACYYTINFMEKYFVRIEIKYLKHERNPEVNWR